MAHLVYTDGRSRFELNLEEEPGFVVELLTWLEERKAARPAAVWPEPLPAAPLPRAEAVYAGSTFGQKPPGFGHLTSPEAALPVSAHAPRVAEPEAAQVSEPNSASRENPTVRCESRHKGRRCKLEVGHDGRHRDNYSKWDGDGEPRATRAALLPRTCKRDGCDVVFQPVKSDNWYCSKSCRKAQVYADGRARRADPVEAGGPIACPECSRTFKTAQALGGHMNGHAGRQRGKAKPRSAVPKVVPESANAPADNTSPAPVTSARKPLAQKSHPAPPGRKVPTAAQPEDRPYRCKEPGCGHPCRSQGDLDSHRRAYHDTRHGIPKVVEVVAAMAFPCPEDGCGRVYEDENRLVHHRRVIHDFEAVPPVHVVEAGVERQAVRVG